MHDRLASLINRMKLIMADPNTRPLLLHWSDVVLLEELQAELTTDDQRIDTLRQALSTAIDQVFEEKKK